MTAPQRTPNPGTLERPERSSKRVDRKPPLGWLPWALLAALAALLLLVLLVINAVDDDGPEGSVGDSLGQVSDGDGESPVGTDGEGGPSGGGGAGAGAAGGALGEQTLSRLSQAALVGGGPVAAGRASEAQGAEALARPEPGTVGTVLFASGSAELDAEGERVLDAAAQSLQDAGVTRAMVVGHTDVVAGDPVNDTLSQERADAVAAALSERVAGLQVATSARGQEEPVAGNDDEAGRQQNRRAVITAVG